MSSFELIIPFIGPLAHLLTDQEVSEIMRNNDGSVYTERGGMLRREPISISDADLRQAIQSIARVLNLEVNDEDPILDAWLPDGSRVAGLLDPIALGGSVLCIRKFDGRKFDLKELIRIGSMTEEAAQILTEQIHNLQSVMISGGTSTGKALAVDTLVFTPTGQRRIGDISVGDFVLGSDGTATKVKGVYPQGVKDGFNVRFADGASVICCEDHLWQVSEKHKPLNIRVVPTKHIRHAIENGGQQFALYIPLASPLQFDAENELPLDPYLLGVLLGDGELGGGQLKLSNPDSQIVDQVRILLAPTGTDLFPVYDHGIDYRISRPEITRNPRIPNNVRAAITSLRLHVHSHEKFIPEIYKFSNVGIRTALLQGLFDTDGSCTDAPGSVEYCTSSKQLADDVMFVSQSLGCMATMNSRIPAYTYKGESRNGKTSYRLYIRIPDSFQPFRLERKLVGCMKGKPRVYRRRRIVSVTPAEPQEMVCISVDAQDGLFVIEKAIVTHNTTCLNALSPLLGDKRIITIEDTAELQLHQPHVVKMVSRRERKGKPEITIRQLVKTAMRMRPDLLILGEVRGPEAMDLLQALNSGHGGSMVTIHAETARRAITKLATYASQAAEIPFDALNQTIGESINVIMQLLRDHNTGRRYVSEIIRIQGYERKTGEFEFKTIWPAKPNEGALFAA